METAGERGMENTMKIIRKKFYIFPPNLATLRPAGEFPTPIARTFQIICASSENSQLSAQVGLKDRGPG